MQTNKKANEKGEWKEEMMPEKKGTKLDATLTLASTEEMHRSHIH